MVEQTADIGLNTEGFSKFLETRSSDPEWLIELRKKAWETYQKIPMPTRRDEYWRRVELRTLRLEETAPTLSLNGRAPGQDSFPEHLKERLNRVDESAGLIVQYNSADYPVSLDSKLTEQGVVFCSFDEAVADHSELVKKHLAKIVTMDETVDNKFTALHYAFLSGGTFLHVPAGVNVDKPFWSIICIDSPGTAIFPHTLLDIGRGATAVYSEERYSGRNEISEETQNISSAVTEVVLDDDANFQYASMQQYDHEAFFFSKEKASVGSRCRLDWLTADIGGRLSKVFVDCDVNGSDTNVEMLGLFYITGRQQVDTITLLNHNVPNTTGNVLFKGVADDQARSSYCGRIIVTPEAQQTDSVLADHTILLSDEARSDSTPTLEIEANDVICKHAASVGQLSNEEMFYLMSRGIDKKQARQMMVLGFYEQVILGIPQEAVQERIRVALRDAYDVNEQSKGVEK